MEMYTESPQTCTTGEIGADESLNSSLIGESGKCGSQLDWEAFTVIDSLSIIIVICILTDIVFVILLLLSASLRSASDVPR